MDTRDDSEQLGLQALADQLGEAQPGLSAGEIDGALRLAHNYFYGPGQDAQNSAGEA